MGAALFAATLFGVGTASADGLVAQASDLPPKERASLEQQIEAYRAKNPAAFEAVRNVNGYKPETYKKFRNPIPLVGRELRRLGEPALLPMLEALAFDVWERGDAADREWTALKVGMLEAVAHLHDGRSAPVVTAAFATAKETTVQSAAAEAVGALCRRDATMVTALAAALEGPKRLAAIDGLGQCRSPQAAQLLASELDSTTSAIEADRIARALGYLGSSWAWRALAKKEGQKGGAQIRREGLEARRIASEALVRGYLRFDGKVRGAHQVGLTMVQHPEVRAIAERHRSAAQASAFAQLERVVARIEKRAHR
jgi:hypothetical protein